MICGGAPGEGVILFVSLSSDPGMKGDDPVAMYGGRPVRLRGRGCLLKLSEDGDTGDCTGGDVP
jgi:hypothetical protein